MPSGDPGAEESPSGWFPGWKTLLVVVGLYAGVVAAATYPVVVTLGSRLPTLVDPLTHIWTMRWYKTCLQEGRSPLLCPEIQYPVGAPLGHLPPMHFQSLLFVPLSFALGNDILCYNIIWFLDFLLMGVGTFLLCCYLIRDRVAAWFGGLVAMLSAPMMWFAHAELEQISVGWFPLLLIAWLRWLDRPSRGRFAWVVGLFLIMTMSAPYFPILSIFPLSLSVAWQVVREGRAGAWPWLRDRLSWFVAFVAVVLPSVALLFSGQLWAAWQGFTVTRGSHEFYGAPLLGYLVPTPPHLLAPLLPKLYESMRLGSGSSFYDAAGMIGSVTSYLGLVTMALIVYAGLSRVTFRRSGFCWLALGLVVVLSIGGTIQVLGHEVPLPGLFLRKYFFAFKLIRVPARFNLLAAVFAAVVAAAGLAHLLARIPRMAPRAIVFASLAGLAAFDLAWVPFGNVEVPAVPPCYAEIHRRDPSAVILEAPQFNAGPFQLSAINTYWQSYHRGTTSAGHTAFRNDRCDDLLTETSPFHALRLADPNYLSDPEAETFDVVRDVPFRDYAWLYLTVHRFHSVVLHQKPGIFPELPLHSQLGRIKAGLIEAKVSEDDATAVFERSRLRPPIHPVALCTEGWSGRTIHLGRFACAVAREGRLSVYNPGPDSDLRLAVEMTAIGKPRTVRVMAGDREIATWTVKAGAYQTFVTPPFRLPAGLQELTLASDPEGRPSSRPPVPGDSKSMSLIVDVVDFRTMEEVTAWGLRDKKVLR